MTEWTITNDQLAINLDHEGARKFPEMLESKHFFEYDGMIYDVPPEDGEWLVLE